MPKRVTTQKGSGEYHRLQWQCLLCAPDAEGHPPAIEYAKGHLAETLTAHLQAHAIQPPDLANWKATPDLCTYTHLDFAQGEHATVKTATWELPDPDNRKALRMVEEYGRNTQTAY